MPVNLSFLPSPPPSANLSPLPLFRPSIPFSASTPTKMLSVLKMLIEAEGIYDAEHNS